MKQLLALTLALTLAGCSTIFGEPSGTSASKALTYAALNTACTSKTAEVAQVMAACTAENFVATFCTDAKNGALDTQLIGLIDAASVPLGLAASLPLDAVSNAAASDAVSDAQSACAALGYPPPAAPTPTPAA